MQKFYTFSEEIAAIAASPAMTGDLNVNLLALTPAVKYSPKRCLTVRR